MKSSRLKNFCEVCRKQCRDENGYHCHLNSGHHQKNLRQLATNPQEHIQKYSNQLQNRIVQTLRSKYPGQPKDIEDIYEEYSQDKFAVKFNFTRWKGLPQFVEHLKTVRNIKVEGKLPFCKVTYVVSKASDFMKRKKEQQLFNKRQRQKDAAEKQIQDRMSRVREMEVLRLKQIREKHMKQMENEEEIDLEKGDFRFDFEEKVIQPNKLFMQTQENQNENIQKSTQQIAKLTNVDKLLNQIEGKDKKTKQIQSEQDEFQWIMPGIMVKIKPHDIPEVFHGKKAAIISIKQAFVAEIKLGNAFLSIDQTFLQTVIPKLGHEVKILKGADRGNIGILKQVFIDQGYGQIEINNNKKKVLFSYFSKTS